MLSPYRVVDLSDEHGLLCGQILADLGADVVQVEPPGGSSARRVAPFEKDEEGPDRSLFWWAYARNKRSVVLDPAAAGDREALLRLVAGADFLIESSRPGTMQARGLDYGALSALNPGLIYVSISPFGQDGPKASWLATDLTIAAAGGTAYLSGEAERPPVRVSVPQAHAHAAADAAVAALIAHRGRQRSGRGCHVDISAQHSVTLATMFRILDAPLAEAPARRMAGGVLLAGNFIPTAYPLRDGWVVLGPAFLPSTGHFMERLLRVAAACGFGDGRLAEEDWNTFALRMLGGVIPGDAYEATDAVLRAFFAAHTKAEIMALGVEHRLLYAPVLGLDEVTDGPQLVERGFIVEEPAPSGEGRVRQLGAFAKFGATPIGARRPAPRIDEHGDALRVEAPRQPAHAAARVGGSAAANGVGGSAAEDGHGLPLEGVKVLDLFWVLAGPGATRMLADYGATVVHVESTLRPDTLRVIPPYQFNNPHLEGSGAFQCANANKLGITLDLTKPEGREIALELASWADVVTESFAPGVIDQYELGYESLRAVNPDLIMISSCLMGQSGPWRNFTGFGNLAASVTGFQQLASWPDRPPSGPYGAYTDFIGVRYNALAILAALEHRARTGEGQYIDMAQAEAALHFVAPAFLDYTVNGRAPEPVGNQDRQHVPHAIYPAAGEDAWVAVAVRDDGEWHALCEAIGEPALRDASRASEEAEQAITGFTSARSAAEVEAVLQAAGVPAHAVLDTHALHACPQLQHRGHFVEIGHDIYQTTTIESSRLRLSNAEPRVPSSAISQGRDNRAVLEGILGRSAESIAELAARGVLR